MYRIFIVEDDRGIACAIKENTEKWGFEAKVAADFRDLMREFSEYDPHLVLLDIALPFYSGYYWCDEIRKVSQVPLIFISSASDSMNIIMAVNMGADDFIAKPFDMGVLIVKIQALLRRAYDFNTGSHIIEHRGVILNTMDGTASYKDSKLPLTKNEYRIMLALMENKGRIVSRERLMELLWETDSFIDENTLSVNVGRLRKKLEAAGIEGFITTRFGVGYISE